MMYCSKCEQEFEADEGCLCAVYRVLMRDGHYRSVPPQWIADWWDEPLYCGYCQSAFMYGMACACEKVPALA